MSRAEVRGIARDKTSRDVVRISEAFPSLSLLGGQAISGNIQVSKHGGRDRFGSESNFGKPSFHLFSLSDVFDDLLKIFVQS